MSSLKLVRVEFSSSYLATTDDDGMRMTSRIEQAGNIVDLVCVSFNLSFVVDDDDDEDGGKYFWAYSSNLCR